MIDWLNPWKLKHLNFTELAAWRIASRNLVIQKLNGDPLWEKTEFGDPEIEWWSICEKKMSWTASLCRCYFRFKEAVRAYGAVRACNQQFWIFAIEVLWQHSPSDDRLHFHRLDASAVDGFQRFLQTFVWIQSLACLQLIQLAIQVVSALVRNASKRHASVSWYIFWFQHIYHGMSAWMAPYFVGIHSPEWISNFLKRVADYVLLDMRFPSPVWEEIVLPCRPAPRVLETHCATHATASLACNWLPILLQTTKCRKDCVQKRVVDLAHKNSYDTNVLYSM